MLRRFLMAACGASCIMATILPAARTAETPPAKLRLLVLYTDKAEERLPWVIAGIDRAGVGTLEGANRYDDVRAATSVDSLVRAITGHVNEIYAAHRLPLELEVVAVRRLPFPEPDAWSDDAAGDVWAFLRGMGSWQDTMAAIRREFPKRGTTSSDTWIDITCVYWGYWAANPGAQVDCGRNGLVRISLYFMDPLTLAHEIGHLQGLEHEDGYTYTVPGDTSRRMSIMSVVGNRRVRYFSDPLSTDSGVALGDETHDSVRKLREAIAKIDQFPQMQGTTWGNDPCP